MPFKKIKLGKRTMDPVSQPFRSTGARMGGRGKGRSEAVGQRCTEKSVCRKREWGTFNTPHSYEVADMLESTRFLLLHLFFLLQPLCNHLMPPPAMIPPP